MPLNAFETQNGLVGLADMPQSPFKLGSVLSAAPGVSTADAGLPPVAPPSGKFILQLFLVPGLIVAGLVLVALGLQWLTGAHRNPEKYLEGLDDPNPEVRWRTAAGTAFLAALAFLTILPVRLREPFSQEELARSRCWYPVDRLGGITGDCLGAAIEVQAQTLAARGQRTQAVAILQSALRTYGTTSIRARLQKNLNLLSFEGHPAPALRAPTAIPVDLSASSRRSRPAAASR